MPGGRIEPGETPEDAARREFLEETGHLLEHITFGMNETGGKVFCGFVGKKAGVPRTEEIAEVGIFEQLPSPLSFPAVEYRKMLDSFRPLLFAKG